MKHSNYFFVKLKITQKILLCIHFITLFVVLRPEPEASGASPHGYFTVYEGLAPEQCQAHVGDFYVPASKYIQVTQSSGTHLSFISFIGYIFVSVVFSFIMK